IYALLPDTHPEPNWDTGNYHANGYAALMELNSLSVDGWQPHDVSGSKERLRLQDPFNGCYLLFNENENSLSVNVSKDIPIIVADFLYQKLVSVDGRSWSSLGRMENAENGDGTPEVTPGSRKGERSKRFLAFGIKRLAIPEEEIREFMTFSFAQQASLQMLYNNWSDSIGFSDEVRNLAFRDFVNQKEVQQNWLITDEHLCLSQGILADEISSKKWKPINSDWMEVIPNFMEVVRPQDSATWLPELSKLCEKRFDQDYRGSGVRKFYEIKSSTRKDHAREIRKRIEANLFEEWKNGSRSIQEVGKLLDAILEELEDRRKLMDDRAVTARDNAQAVGEKITANLKEAAKVGLISAMIGKRKRLLEAQAAHLQEYYIYKTRFAAWEFAKELIPDLISELNGLRNEVSRCMSLLSESAKEFKDGIDGRCCDDGEADLRRPLVHFYNPEIVKEFTRYLTRDKRVQQAQVNDVRLAIVEHLGENPDFTTFKARLNKQRLIDIMESRCLEGAINAHNNLIASDRDKSRQLGVSIVEKLYREYGGNIEGLRSYIHSLVRSAGNYLIFDPLEVNKVGPGIPGAPAKISQFTVILPNAPEHADFLTTLREIFRAGLAQHMEFVERDNKPNEIALISITNLFPLRFVSQLQYLRQCYEARLCGSDPARAKLELHCEGEGMQHPRLFVASGEDLRKEGLPFILISKVLGIIQEKESPTTGKNELLLLTKDEHGFDNPPVRLGSTLTESVEMIDSENIEQIRSVTNKVLAQGYVHKEKQEELRKQVLQEVEAIKTERKGDIDDPIYQRFLEAGRRAMKIINGEG
ncbi:MAG: tubulin-like doman-containing protein, partial [Acidobacteriota bacterium]